MFAKTFSARRLGAVLATALIVAPLCPGAPAWQYTHTGGSVNALTEHDGEFIALRSDGALLFSGDARAWEKRAAFESQTRMHAVGDAYLFLSLAGEPRDITRTAIIRRTTDFESFDTVFESEVPRSTTWRNALLETPGGSAALLSGSDHTEILLTADGTEWNSVFSTPGPALRDAWTTPTGRTALTLAGSFPVPWLESYDGVEWTHHNTFIGKYVALNGMYIGIGALWATAGAFASPDTHVWTRADVDLPPGPPSIAAGNGRAVIQFNARSTLVTTDGRTWTHADLPEPAENPPHRVTFGFFNGRFWLSRTALYPPEGFGGDGGFGEPEVFSSVDGIVWTGEEAMPPDFTDESGVETISETPLPEESVAIPLSVTPVAAEASYGLTHVRLALEPDTGRHALFQTIADGPERRVDTTWGSVLTGDGHDPFKLVAANGVFLVRNVHGRLGFFEDGSDYLPQPVARFEGPASEFAVRLWWEPVDGADFYRIHRETEMDGGDAVRPLVNVGETTATVWLDQDEELDKENAYRYTVTAHADDGRESHPGRRVDTRLMRVWDFFEMPPPTIGQPVGTWFPVPYVGYGNTAHKPWTRTLGGRWWHIHEVHRGFWAWDAGSEQWLWSALDAYPWVYDPESREWIEPATEE